MNPEIENIVSSWVNKGVHIPQETVNYVLWYCERKMDINKPGNREEYLPLLFADELKNYLYSQFVNSISMAKMSEGKCVECAVFV